MCGLSSEANRWPQRARHTRRLLCKLTWIYTQLLKDALADAMAITCL